MKAQFWSPLYPWSRTIDRVSTGGHTPYSTCLGDTVVNSWRKSTLTQGENKPQPTSDLHAAKTRSLTTFATMWHHNNTVLIITAAVAFVQFFQLNNLSVLLLLLHLLYVG